MKKCKNCNIKYPDEKKFCKDCGEPLIEIHEIDPEIVAKRVLFDSSKWFERNVKYFVGLIILGIITYAVYYFILRPDPIRDAKSLAKADCDCELKYNEDELILYREFLSTFDSQKFERPTQAMFVLDLKRKKLVDEYSLCLKKNLTKSTDIMAKYSSNKEYLIQFNKTYQSSKTCEWSKRGEWSTLGKEIDYKISLIIDKTPHEQGQMSKSAIEQQIQGVQDPSALPTFPQSAPQKK